jgi:hypothetical protein
MMNMRYPMMMVKSSDLYGSATLDSGNQQGRIARLVRLACGRMNRYFNHAEEQAMSNQQKDNPSPGGTAPVHGQPGKAGDGGQGLRRKEKDDTGGPRGDELSNAVGAAAGDANKGGASTA